MTLLARPAPLRRRGAWSASQRSPGIAIDLGSARTRAWMPDRGLIFDVPTITSSGGDGKRGAALAALEILDARTVLTIDSVKAAALGAAADLTQPLLVVDIGAHLTEVGLLVDGGVTQANRFDMGTADLGATTTVAELVQSIVAVVTDLLRLECGGQVVDTLDRGPLLTGGGALRPEITYRLSKRLLAPVRPAPAPQLAAVRGAGLALVAAQRHPSVPGEDPQ